MHMLGLGELGNWEAVKHGKKKKLKDHREDMLYPRQDGTLLQN